MKREIEEKGEMNKGRESDNGSTRKSKWPNKGGDEGLNSKTASRKPEEINVLAQEAFVKWGGFG